VNVAFDALIDPTGVSFSLKRMAGAPDVARRYQACRTSPFDGIDPASIVMLDPERVYPSPCRWRMPFR
jgi:hypothetical protein